MSGDPTTLEVLGSWGGIVGGLGGVAGVLGGYFSWSQKKEAQTAARSAEDALAWALVPSIVVGFQDDWLDGSPTNLRCFISNDARYDALQVDVEIRLVNGRQLGAERFAQVKAAPGVPGKGQHMPLRALPELDDVHSSQDVIVVAQFYDHIMRAKWKQESTYKLFRKYDEFGGPAGLDTPTIQHMPVQRINAA